MKKLPSHSRPFRSQRLKLPDPVFSKRDRQGHWFLIPTPGLATYVTRARQFQKQFFEGMFIRHGPAAQVIATSIVMEALNTVEELERFLKAAEKPILIGDNLAVTWTASDGRLDRRFLHACTQLALSRLPCIPDWKAELSDFDALLGSVRTRQLCGSGNLPHLAGLLLDMTAWHFEHLPVPLFFHVSRIVPAAVLPDSAYARRVVGRPLAQQTSDEKLDTDADAARASVMDAVLSSTNARSGAWLIDELKKLGAQQLRKSRPDGRRDWLKSLVLLADECRGTGAATALLCGWVIHMLTIGTVRERKPSPATIYAYFAAVATEIHQELSGKDVLQMASDELKEAYNQILARKSSNMQAASALNAFHAFLVDEFDISPIRKLLASERSAVTRANQLWEHEAITIRAWFGVQGANERLSSQVRLAFELGWNLHLRIGEIFGLRVRSVRQYQGHGLELEIAPGAHDRYVKSRSSRRVINITDSEMKNALCAWTIRRKQEAAMPEDFLFGDPHAPNSVYMPGKTYVTLARLLKTASGDTHMSPHVLRHGVSIEMENTLISLDQEGEINPFDVIAAKMGHSSIQTDYQSYFHLPEKPLRHWIDRGLIRHKFGYRTVASLTGISEIALRKKVSRSNNERNAELTDAMITCAKKAPATRVEAQFSFGDCATDVHLNNVRPLSIQNVCDVLADIADGMPVEVVALRNTMSPGDVREISSLALASLATQFPTKRTWRQLIQEDPVFVLQQPESASMTACFRRRHQANISRLVQYISDHSNSQPVIEGLASWQACTGGKYISLVAPDLAIPLIKLFYMAGVPLVHLVVRVVHTGDCERKSDFVELRQKGLAYTLSQAFESTYGAHPQVELVALRRGRPRVYLLISNAATNGTIHTNNAATAVDALHALMISLASWNAFQKNCQMPRQSNTREAAHECR